MPARARTSFLLAALLAASTPVLAQPPVETPAAGGTDEATRLFKKGNDAYRMKKWEEAAAAFKEAWALKQSYDIAGNLGDVEIYLGRYRDAAEHLEYSLRNWPAGQEEAKKRTAERFAEAKKHVGTLSLKVSEGAEIMVNGKVVGRSPLPGPVFVGPGATTIVARKGEKSVKKTVALDLGDWRELELVIAGEAPAVGPSAAPGADQGAPASAGAGATAGGDVKPPSGSSVKTVGMIASGALAAIGLGVGVGFYLKQQSAKDDAEAYKAEAVNQFGTGGCPKSGKTGVCADLAEANDEVRSSGTLSTIGFIGAGVGAAGFVAFFLMPGSKRSTSLAPLVDRHTVGLAASGRF